MNIFKRVGRLLAVGSAALAVAFTPLVSVPVSAAADEAASTVTPAAAPDACTIGGDAKVGETLKASGCAEPYQWYANKVAIEGATKQTYFLTPAELDKTITVGTSDSTPKVGLGTLMTVIPTITGTAAIGSKLTAEPGKWTDGTEFSYQWYVGDAKIEGATKSTFTPASAHRDKTVWVEVTGTLAGYEPATEASATVKVSDKALTTAVPKITGIAKVGKKLTVDPGTWTKGTKFSYQWYAGDKKIKGATKSTFTLTASEMNMAVAVKVTGGLPDYKTASKTSASVKVKAGTLSTKTPTISGTAKFGKKLTAKPGKWTSGTKFGYQWYANGKKIKGATKSTYTLKAAQNGKKITVKVTGSKSGYAKAAKTSKATKKVVPATLKTAKPTFSGSVRPGSTLVASPGKWTSGTKFSYQWYANGKKIKGATGKSFYVTSGHINSAIKVKVTGKKSGYKTASKSSSRKGVSWRMPTGDQPNLKNYTNISVEVSIAKQRVYIKSGKTVIYEMRASTGTDYTPTVRGTFSIKGRGPQFMNPDGVGARYWVRFYEEYLFHAVPMDVNGNYLLHEAEKLGSKASHGCIRLSVSDAIWFYEQIPTGAKVRVY